MSDGPGDRELDELIVIGPEIRVTETRILKGPADEPVVVEQVFGDGTRNKTRLVNSERKNPLPIFVFWDETVRPEQQILIREAMGELVDAVGLQKDGLHFYGNWHEEVYRDASGKLLSNKSISWQVESKLNLTRKQVNAGRIVGDMYDDPYQLAAPHWEVIFTNKDLYSEETNFVIGGAIPDLGTIMSLVRFDTVQDPKLRDECIKTEIFHEVGHVLGLIEDAREANIEHSLGTHCTNRGCSMKQGLRVPRDWIEFTQERLEVGGQPFCEECTDYLGGKFEGGKISS